MFNSTYQFLGLDRLCNKVNSLASKTAIFIITFGVTVNEVKLSILIKLTDERIFGIIVRIIVMFNNLYRELLRERQI